MIAALTTLLLGTLLLVVQGALATFLPRAIVPDTAPLVAIGLARHLPGGLGFATALGLGVVADVLSASPTGQLALVQALAFALASTAHAGLDLRTARSQAVLGALVAPVSALVLLAVGATLRRPPSLDLSFALQVAGQSLAAALCAPGVGRMVGGVVGMGRDDDGTRRAVVARRGG